MEQRKTPTSQPSATTVLHMTSRPQTPSVSWATWIIGAAAVMVTLAAAALVVGKPTDAPVTPKAEVLDSEPPTTTTSPPLTPRGPLDLSALHLDAQERARIWNEASVLSGISLMIENGIPIATIEFEFGTSMGEPTPGTALGRQRHVISYLKGEATARSEESPRHRVVLTPPNCTLDAAYRALLQAGVPKESRIGVMLIHSEKHRRPVWLMTSSDGNAYHINAESCVLLRR
jgi:hypothetical protein